MLFRRRAMTLLEVLMVVGLFSLLLVMGTYNLPWLGRGGQARSLAEELAGQLQDIRSQAQAQHTYTALALGAESSGQVRAWGLLEGTHRAEQRRWQAWHLRYRGLSGFAGVLPGSGWGWAPDDQIQLPALDLSVWAGPWANQPLLIFTPSGAVVGLNWPHQNGRYRCMIAQGLSTQADSLAGRPVPRLSAAHRPVAVSISATGAVQVEPTGQWGSLDPGHPLPVPPPQAPPSTLPQSQLAITAVDLQPKQNQDLLNGQTARVEAEAYLHLTVRARGGGQEPLRCLWTSAQGATSARQASQMVWKTDHYESTWEWQAPPEARAGDRYRLSCEVRDARDQRAEEEAQTFVDVEIIKSSRILFSSTRDGNPDLYMVNRDGSRLRRLTYTAGLEGRPQLSPDGSRMFYTSEGDLYLCDRDGQNPHRLTFYGSGAGAGEPTWNPLGTQIAFSRRLGSSQLCIIDADPLHPHVRTVGTFPGGSLGFISWSSDNSRLVYDLQMPDGSLQLHEYILTADRHRQLRTSSLSEYQGRCSPDGQHLLYTRKHPATKIWVSRYLWDTPTGDGRLEDDVRLVSDGPWNSDPFWAPDGQSLVFGSRRPGGNMEEERIWSQPIDPLAPATKLSLTQARDWDPTWGR